LALSLVFILGASYNLVDVLQRHLRKVEARGTIIAPLRAIRQRIGPAAAERAFRHYTTNFQVRTGESAKARTTSGGAIADIASADH